MATKFMDILVTIFSDSKSQLHKSGSLNDHYTIEIFCDAVVKNSLSNVDSMWSLLCDRIIQSLMSDFRLVRQPLPPVQASPSRCYASSPRCHSPVAKPPLTRPPAPPYPPRSHAFPYPTVCLIRPACRDSPHPCPRPHCALFTWPPPPLYGPAYAPREHLSMCKFFKKLSPNFSYKC